MKDEDVRKNKELKLERKRRKELRERKRTPQEPVKGKQ